MESHQQETSPTPDKPSFFGPPAAWTQFGAMFWGGVVMGICFGVGFGLLIGAELVANGTIAPQKHMPLVGTALVLQLIGIASGRAIAMRSIRRGQLTK
jgi:hypothetical protein